MGATEIRRPAQHAEVQRQRRCPHRKAHRPGRTSWRSPTKAARMASSSSTATCTIAWRSAARLVNLAGYLENDLLAGFQVVLVVRPRQRTHDRARRRARREVGRRGPEGAAARAAAGDSVHQPLPALSRQPARARPRGEGERRGHPARRRSHRAGRRRGLRARQPHQRAARMGVGSAVLRSALHQHPDRGQSQRRRAADRVQRARVAHSRAAARCAGAGARARHCCKAQQPKRSPPTPNLPQLAGGAGRRHGRRRSKAW